MKMKYTLTWEASLGILYSNMNVKEVARRDSSQFTAQHENSLPLENLHIADYKASFVLMKNSVGQSSVLITFLWLPVLISDIQN